MFGKLRNNRLTKNVTTGNNSSIINSKGKSTVTVNGKTITVQGNNIVVNNGKITVDGKVIEEGLSGDVNITVEGDVKNLTVSGSAEIKGDVLGNVDAGSSVQVSGNVSGDVDAGSSVNANIIEGDVDAGSSVNYSGRRK